MITLTVPVVRQITKLRATGVGGLDSLSDDPSAIVRVDVGNASGVLETQLLTVRNGISDGLTGGVGTLVTITVATPTGLTDLRAAVAAASGKAAKLLAVESWLLSAGLVPSGTVT